VHRRFASPDEPLSTPAAAAKCGLSDTIISKRSVSATSNKSKHRSSRSWPQIVVWGRGEGSIVFGRFIDAPCSCFDEAASSGSGKARVQCPDECRDQQQLRSLTAAPHYLLSRQQRTHRERGWEGALLLAGLF